MGAPVARAAARLEADGQQRHVAQGPVGAARPGSASPASASSRPSDFGPPCLGTAQSSRLFPATRMAGSSVRTGKPRVVARAVATRTGPLGLGIAQHRDVGRGYGFYGGGLAAGSSATTASRAAMAPLARMPSGRQNATRSHQPARGAVAPQPRLDARPTPAPARAPARPPARAARGALPIPPRRAPARRPRASSAAGGRARARAACRARTRRRAARAAQACSCSSRQLFSFSRPRRTQVFTVPSGSRRWLASSACDRPS